MDFTAGIVLFLVIIILVIIVRIMRIGSSQLQDLANFLTISSVIAAVIWGMIVAFINFFPFKIQPQTENSTYPTPARTQITILAINTPSVPISDNYLSDSSQCKTSAYALYETTFTQSDESLWTPYRSSGIADPQYDSILGPFGNEEVTLALNNLNVRSPHSEVWIILDLHIVLSWDGNYFRDFWGLKIDGNSIFLTTFDNWMFANDSTHTQDFPNQYSGSQMGAFPPRTNAISNNTLGFIDNQTQQVSDSTYNLCFKVPHSADSIQIVFFGSELENAPGKLEDESWALDNVAIYGMP